MGLWPLAEPTGADLQRGERYLEIEGPDGGTAIVRVDEVVPDLSSSPDSP